MFLQKPLTISWNLSVESENGGVHKASTLAPSPRNVAVLEPGSMQLREGGWGLPLRPPTHAPWLPCRTSFLEGRKGRKVSRIS